MQNDIASVVYDNMWICEGHGASYITSSLVKEDGCVRAEVGYGDAHNSKDWWTKGREEVSYTTSFLKSNIKLYLFLS